MQSRTTAQFSLGVGALSAGTSAAILQGGAVSVALPAIAELYSTSDTEASLLILVYQLCMAASLLPLSLLGRRLGIHKMFVLGQLILGASYLMAAFSDSFAALLLMRAVQGIGAAATLGMAPAIIKMLYAPERLGRGIALNSLVATTSGVVAPTIGGLLIEKTTFTWLFALGSPLVGAALILSFALPRSAGQGIRINPLECAGYALSISFVVGWLGSFGWTDLVRWSAMGLLTISILGLFARHERRLENPIIPLDLLMSRNLGPLFMANFFIFNSLMLFIVTQPFRLVDLGLAPSEMGVAMAFFPAAMMVVSPTTAFLTDFLSTRKLLVVGVAVASAGVFLFSLTESGSMRSIVLGVILAGGGYSVLTSTTGRAVVSAVPLQITATAGSLMGTIRQLAQASGAAMFGMLNVFQGSSWRAALAMSVGFLFLAAASFVALPRERALNSGEEAKP